MRIVAALGGNALLRRGQALTATNQRANVAQAVTALAPLAQAHSLVITHGNGPQVGLLALQAAAYRELEPYPLDVLGAQSEGMIGYLIEQELANHLPDGPAIATLLTMIEVNADDPGFNTPEKPIGPVYSIEEGERIARQSHWKMRPDGEGLRRVVASPAPQKILEIGVIELLLKAGVIVICTGGGGIPVVRGADGGLHGVEAVIDKDHASALLARQLGADQLLLLTDVEAVILNYGTPRAKPICRGHPDALRRLDLPAGSMAPKVAAACDFVTATGKPAVIGNLQQVDALLAGRAGTWVGLDVKDLETV